jgi:hypothetical protein
MKKILTIVGLVLVLAAGGVVVMLLRAGPDPAQFADLKDPRLTEIGPQKMLVVEATGDPSVVAGKAFKQLFATYYRMEGVSRMSAPPAPRARWQFTADTPRFGWRGAYALPIPAGATLPSMPGQSEFPVTIADWRYGAVAEVAHMGPYSNEESDISRLHEFVRSRGYRTIGDHEEEYVKGPGMVFAGNPEQYITIIRVRVEKAEVPNAASTCDS